MLYDLSSSYVEGRCCPLAALGHSRDGKPGKPQVNWGLVCSPDGRPVAVQVHPGNTADPTTVPDVIDTVKERFGIERVILVGDRAMITDAHAATLKELGAGFVSALKSAQIRKLMKAGDLQLSLFDQTNLAEITSTEFPGERLVVCRNPHLAAERARKREDLLAATERELDKVTASVTNPRGRLHHADAGAIGQRVGRVINKYKVAKHFELEITDGAFTYQRKTEQIADRGRARRALRAAHHLPRRAAHHPSGRARLQTAEDGRARVPHDQGRARRPPDPPPPPRPRRSALLPVPARLLPAVRAPSPARADALHRRHATHPRRPRRARPTLPRREHQGRQPPHPRRAARLQPHRPDHRTRHHLPQPTTHRRQPPHLPPPHQHQPRPSQSARDSSTPTSASSQSQTSPKPRIPRQHAGFVISRPKTSG